MLLSKLYQIWWALKFPDTARGIALALPMFWGVSTYFHSGDRTFLITQIDIPNPDIVLWMDNKFSISSIGPVVQFLQVVLKC